MRLLSVTLVLLVMCWGCATYNYKNLKQIESKTIDSSDLAPLFKNTSPAPLYKAEVSLYGKIFGGLLLIKYMPDSSYRIVFTTETAIKLFDFELKDEKFNVIYCIEKFNRDAVLNTIAGDIKLLLLENRIAQNASLLSDSETNQLIYKFNANENEVYYYKNTADKLLAKVEQAKGHKKKVVINLWEYKNTVPAHIKITHHNIRLKINLTLIER